MKTLFKYWGLPIALAALCALLLVSADAHAQGQPEARPLSTPGTPQALRVRQAEIRLDGRLDDALWRDAPRHERFSQYHPEVAAAPSRWRTTVQVVADDDALVFGIRAWDDAPEQIRSNLTRRDGVRRDQDFVVVVLDPVGRRQAAQFVRVSVLGTVSDGIYTATDDGEDFSPDFDVQAAAQRLPDGYSVELRWPLAALRYPYAEGLPWRMMVARSLPRDASHLLVSAPLARESLSFIAELQEIGGLDDLVASVRERSFMSLRPELTARAVSQRDGDGRHQRERTLELGAEFKWRPRADWVLDATLNPDFSQVELDTPQLAGNTRFALFVPEKRAFFLESRDVVGQTQPDESGLARGAATFYSRTVVDPAWGLRATWRGPHAEATAMSLRDGGGGQVLRPHAYGTESHSQPLDSQASFMRARSHWGVGDGELALAGLGSVRDYGQGRHNSVMGSDWLWQPGGGHAIRGHALLSSTTAAFDAADRLVRAEARRGHNLWLGWRHRSEGFSSELNLDEISTQFANDNGFVPQSGLRRVRLDLRRNADWQEMAPLGEWSRVPVYEMQWQLMVQDSRALADQRPDGTRVAAGEVLEQRLHPGFWLVSARNTEVWGHVALDRQRARAGGRLHSLRALHLGLSSNPLPWLGLVAAELDWGERLDVEADRVGRGGTIFLEAKSRFALGSGRSLELEPRWEFAWLRDAQGRMSLREQAAQLMAVLHWSAQDSVRAVLQGSKLVRRAAPGLEGVQGSDARISLVYQHRQGLQRILSVGWSHGAERPGLARQSELFSKLVQAF